MLNTNNFVLLTVVPAKGACNITLKDGWRSRQYTILNKPAYLDANVCPDGEQLRLFIPQRIAMLEPGYYWVADVELIGEGKAKLKVLRMPKL